MHVAPYDALIVGGGPAGLTCAIFLARYLRRVLVIDEGRPRNYASRGVHGFLGQHGILPFELLKRGREEATESGAEIREGRVLTIERVGDVFECRLSTDECVPARRIVLAYGVRDTIPEIPEIEKYYGVSVHHCPDCDGYEAREKRIGVIGWGKKAVALALKLLQWSEDVVVFTHGHDREWEEEEHSKLLAEGIDVKDEPIVALEGDDGKVRSVVLDTGERVPAQALFFVIKVERSCDLAEQLGCEVDGKKPDIEVDDRRRTTVEGVWAVGDIIPGSQLAITSAADGALAAIDINLSLLPPSRQV
jgi:thioredoxin reductase